MAKLSEPIRKSFTLTTFEETHAMDVIREYLQAERPGSNITDSDIIRFALLLEAGRVLAEADHPLSGAGEAPHE